MDLAENVTKSPFILSCHRVLLQCSKHTVCFFLSLCFFFFFTSTPSLDPSSNFIHPLTFSFTLPTCSFHLPLVLSVSSFLPLVLTLPLQFSILPHPSHFSALPPLAPFSLFNPLLSSISLPVSVSSSFSLLFLPLAASCNLLLLIINLQSTKHAGCKCAHSQAHMGHDKLDMNTASAALKNRRFQSLARA